MEFLANACELEVGKMQKDSVMIPHFLNVFRTVKAKIRIFKGFSHCLLA